MKSSMESLARKRHFTETLLAWHAGAKVFFPWRETGNPYVILLSEMLLRKTTRGQVRKIFPKFFGKYPNIESVASAPLAEIRSMIAPLGMHNKRSALLKRLAKILVKSGGEIPMHKMKLMDLPGVGEYTANAVLCFAAEQDTALVDTNTLRVVKRIFSKQSTRKRPHTDPAMWDFVSKLIPKKRARIFNLAVIDFAAAVCLPRNPSCHECPMLAICNFGQGQVKT